MFSLGDDETYNMANDLPQVKSTSGTVWESYDPRVTSTILLTFWIRILTELIASLNQLYPTFSTPAVQPSLLQSLKVPALLFLVSPLEDHSANCYPLPIGTEYSFIFSPPGNTFFDFAPQINLPLLTRVL
jgi:hypothetical protein